MKVLLLFITLSFSIPVFSQQIPAWKATSLQKYLNQAPGEVLVINMWATYCKPCVEEIPKFIRVKHKYEARVSLILVSLDIKSYYPHKIEEFVRKNKYTVPVVWLDETDADYFCPFLDPSWSGVIPATLIFNRKTGYRKFFEEEISEADFEKEILKALGQ